MKVRFRYSAFLACAADVGVESLEVPDRADRAALIRCVTDRHGHPLAGLLLDHAGDLRSSVLVAVDGAQLAPQGEVELGEASEVFVMLPIAGG